MGQAEVGREEGRRWDRQRWDGKRGGGGTGRGGTGRGEEVGVGRGEWMENRVEEVEWMEPGQLIKGNLQTIWNIDMANTSYCIHLQRELSQQSIPYLNQSL